MEIQFLRERECHELQQAFERLQHPVHLFLFLATDQDEYGAIISGLLDELVSLHPYLSQERRTMSTDAALMSALGIDKTPAIMVLGGHDRADYNIRFYGLPSGHTFSLLIEVILMVGGAVPIPLQPETQQFLAQLSSPRHMKVFITAANGACPPAVLRAYGMAHASPYIDIEVVEVLAFPQLSARYTVRYTPTTVINEQIVIEGEISERELLDYLRLAPA
ncbi:MAG: thioredoxin family protein [Chloroflexales bacterium]